jgi:predicted kinase
MSVPCLIIVTGRPAAGKSTLARWLAAELQLPLVSKDAIREVLFDRLGWKDRPWAQLLGRASIDLMFYFAEAQLSTGHSLILDNAFAPALSTERFQALKSRFGARSIQIVCDSDPATPARRFSERAQAGNRHPGHGDQAVIDNLKVQLEHGDLPEQPFLHVMDLGDEVIKIDTTDFNQINYPALLQRVKACLPPSAHE